MEAEGDSEQMGRRLASLLAGLLAVAAAMPASAGGRHGMVAAPGFRSHTVVITSPVNVVRPFPASPRIVGGAPAIWSVLIGRGVITPVIIVNPFRQGVPGIQVAQAPVPEHRFGLAAHEAPALLLLEARPLDAHVFLNGRFVGTAAHFTAQALAIPAGQHAVKITATGFEPFATEIESRATLPTSLSVSLTPK